MKNDGIKFILLILFFVSLSFAVGFLSGSILSYKNCLIKYEPYRHIWGNLPFDYLLVISLKHVFENPLTSVTWPGGGNTAPSYPLAIAEQALFTNNHFDLLVLNNKEKKFKILANSININISFADAKCARGPLEDIVLSPNELYRIRIECNVTNEYGVIYFAQLNTTFIDLSSGEKIYGNAFLWGRTETHLE